MKSSYSQVRESSITAGFTLCWERDPAFLLALSSVLGAFSAIHQGWFPPCLLAIFILFLPRKPAFFLFLSFLLTFFVSMNTLYTPSSFPSEGVKGTAILSFTSLQEKQTRGGKQLCYRGTISAFTSEDFSLPPKKQIPITLYKKPSKKKAPPSPDWSYQIKGTLKKGGKRFFSFRPEKSAEWQPIKKNNFLVEMRFRLKKWVKHYISQVIPHKDSAAFLSGITTGELDQQELSFAFGRFGLQHILAISGFHFVLLAATLRIVLSLFFPYNLSHFLLIFLLTTYFLFVGPSPSITRAWIMAILLLSSCLFKKQARSLNSLGVAILLMIFMNPLVCESIGFQLSVVATASILLLYSPFSAFLQKIIPTRSFKQASSMHPIQQPAYCLLICTRSSLSLTLALLPTMLPLLIYHFRQYPLLSLLYNLFYPFLISLSIVLFIVGVFLSFLVPPAATFLHQVNSAYTKQVLNLTMDTPSSLDFVLHFSLLPDTFLLFTFTFCSFFALIFHYVKDEKSDSQLTKILVS